MFSKKATKIDEIFTVNLTLGTMRQIDGEDLVSFCGFLRKYELYFFINLKHGVYKLRHLDIVDVF